jgi:acetyl-CoA carboxylase biotin carboxyl carrier protein
LAIVNVESEITGKVWKIEAKAGDKLEEGDTVMILEAMKMEIPVEMPSAGTIKEILVGEGDSVAEGAAVASIET